MWEIDEFNDIVTVINNLAIIQGAGLDNISTETSKHIALFIAQPLAEIVNRSFSNWLVTDSLKIARVGPIFKSGGSAEFFNYRPISVLSSFSKAFEKLIHNCLINYHTQHSILYENHYGF
jgi:Notch-like protein